MADLTAESLLSLGLSKVGIDEFRRATWNLESQNEHFRSFYGSNPSVLLSLWQDLQTPGPHHDTKRKVDYFLMANNLLKCYPTETQQSSTFKCAIGTLREWNWYYIAKFQALKAKKVSK
jgi:hypothetical protein